MLCYFLFIFFFSELIEANEAFAALMLLLQLFFWVKTRQVQLCARKRDAFIRKKKNKTNKLEEESFAHEYVESGNK